MSSTQNPATITTTATPTKPQKAPERSNDKVTNMNISPTLPATTTKPANANKSNNYHCQPGLNNSGNNSATVNKCDNIPSWFSQQTVTNPGIGTSTALNAASSKRSALLTALNCVYESVDSNDSAESLLADAVRKVDTPDGVRLLRALTFATNDLEFESELCNNLSDFISRIPSRFFEHQSAAKGVNVTEVRKMHNRQLLLQQSFDRDFDHDLWDELTAKCEHESRHLSPSRTDSKSNTPNSNRNVSFVIGSADGQNIEYEHTAASNSANNGPTSATLPNSPTTTSTAMAPQQMVRNESFQRLQTKLTLDHSTVPTPVPEIAIDPVVRHDRLERVNLLPLGLSRKISCPQINFDSWSGEPGDESCQMPAALPESGTQYLALVGSLLSELSPESELNQMYFIEIALVSSIQSLKLSLDFYRYFMFHSGSSQKPANANTRLRTGMADDAHANTNDRLYLQNLYLDTLEVETMLYDCLDRFRHNKGRAFATKHIQKLQKAVSKMNDIQASLHRITSSSAQTSSLSTPTTMTTTLSQPSPNSCHSSSNNETITTSNLS